MLCNLVIFIILLIAIEILVRKFIVADYERETDVTAKAIKKKQADVISLHIFVMVVVVYFILKI